MLSMSLFTIEISLTLDNSSACSNVSFATYRCQTVEVCVNYFAFGGEVSRQFESLVVTMRMHL